MKDNDAEASKARAEELRKQIEELISPKTESDTENSELKETEKESPREFIHRKMKEAEEKAGGDNSKP